VVCAEDEAFIFKLRVIHHFKLDIFSHSKLSAEVFLQLHFFLLREEEHAFDLFEGVLEEE